MKYFVVLIYPFALIIVFVLVILFLLGALFRTVGSFVTEMIAIPLVGICNFFIKHGY